jgi:Tol biopolymer transport system component
LRSPFLVPVVLIFTICLAVPAVGGGGSPRTRRVSVSSSGNQADGFSRGADITPNGRFVVFSSSAENLVPSDDNGFQDVFLRDRKMHKTRRLSITSNEEQSENGDSFDPSISGNGRFIVFTSSAEDLVPADDNGQSDVFIRDRVTGTTRRVSARKDGPEPNGFSEDAKISRNGRFVVFSSEAENLTFNDDNELRDIFIYNRLTRRIRLVSLKSNGNQTGDGDSLFPAVSGDGRRVVFISIDENLVPGDDNMLSDVFLRNRDTGKTKRVNVPTSDAQAEGGGVSRPAISADGRVVAFESSATNLVPNDENTQEDIFVRILPAQRTRRMSLLSNGDEFEGGNCEDAVVSSNGRFVAFESRATNLPGVHLNGDEDVLIRDRRTGSTKLVNRNSAGEQASAGDSSDPAITDGARLVAFTSLSNNLVGEDTNMASDVFLRGPLR